MEPTSSKGRSPWKVKKGGGTVAGGIVIRKGDILVNQGLTKVKLEEDYVDMKPELPILMEMDAVSSGGEAISEEEHQVIKVEVDIADIPMSSEDTPAPSEDVGRCDHHDDSSICCTDVENESLKSTVNKLRLQVEKQNEAIRKQEETIQMQNDAIKKQNGVIGGLNALIHNFGLSITTYLNNDEEEGNGDGGRYGNNEEPPANHFGRPAEDSLVLERPSGSSGASTSSQLIPDIPVFMKPISIIDPGQCTELGNMNVDGEDVEGNEVSSQLDDHADADHKENGDAGTQVANDSKGEADKDMEDYHHQDRQELQLNEAKLSATKTNKEEIFTTDSTANSDGSFQFQCSKCEKSFNSQSGLQLHMYVAHSAKRLQFKCQLCPKVFRSNKGVRAHIRSTHKGVRFGGNYSQTSTDDAMYTVVQPERSIQKQKRSGPPGQQCSICGMRFAKTKNSLEIHVAKMHKSTSCRTRARAKSMQTKRKPGATLAHSLLECSVSIVPLLTSNGHGTTTGTGPEAKN